MATAQTTVSVRPERAEALREIRDEHELRSLDAALAKVLTQAGVQ